MKKIRLKYLLIFIVICYLGFSAGKTFYQNWTVNEDVDELRVEIDKLEQDNQILRDSLDYYQSDSYRERIARERFGLQKPGEEVIVIVPNEEPVIVEEEKKEEKSNPQKWWGYLFPSLN